MPPVRSIPRRAAGRRAGAEPGRGRPRPLAVLLAAAISATVAGPGPADPAGAATTVDTAGRNRNGLFVSALRRDPIYVSPALVRVAGPSERAALRREVEAMPYPTFVVVTPRLSDEPDADQEQERAAVLHDRLGRDGLYLYASESGSVAVAAFGVTPRGDGQQADLDAYFTVHRREGPLARVRVALRQLRTGVRPPGAARAQAARAQAAAYERNDGGDGGPPAGLVVVAAFAIGLVLPPGIAAVTPAARRRRQQERNAAGPRLVAAAPRDEARREALDAVAGLARAIAVAPTPSDRAQRRYDAASKLLEDADADPLALIASAVLARSGRALLTGGEGDWRPCFFDPRHGEGTVATRWRQGSADVPLPACAACAKAIAAQRPPSALADGDQPYWQRDTLWARTGFGAIDDRLADDVLAGRGGRR